MMNILFKGNLHLLVLVLINYHYIFRTFVKCTCVWIIIIQCQKSANAHSPQNASTKLPTNLTNKLKAPYTNAPPNCSLTLCKYSTVIWMIQFTETKPNTFCPLSYLKTTYRITSIQWQDIISEIDLIIS